MPKTVAISHESSTSYHICPVNQSDVSDTPYGYCYPLLNNKLSYSPTLDIRSPSDVVLSILAFFFATKQRARHRVIEVRQYVPHLSFLIPLSDIVSLQCQRLLCLLFTVYGAHRGRHTEKE